LCSHCRERYYPQIAPCIIVPIRLAKPRLDSTGTGTNSVILDGFIEQGLMVFEQGYDSNVLGITEEGKKAKVWSGFSLFNSFTWRK
ncbi:hypothetical protein GFK20_23385, partial [Salmonella enterica subsp. enterica serovar Enteritidis]|nr:hypothetical protein [Salmonella enterica subsp. enterica serovar Enteritidis]